MRDNFKTALSFVLKHEGGYVDHPADPGGATNYGITQATYDEWNGGKSRSVKSINMGEVEAIYRKNYWEAVHGDDLPPGIDYCVFDFAVNSGPRRAIKYLQTALGVEVDGYMGPVTIRQANDVGPRPVIKAICDARLQFLRGLPTWDTFGKGWASRVIGVQARAYEMVLSADQRKSRGEPAVLADYETPTEKDTSMTINAPALSKINWTNIVAAGATLFSVFGLDVSPETQVQIVTGIALASQVLSVIFRTFMTGK